MKEAIKVFNSWANQNKDEGMEKNHAFSVNKMLDLIPSKKLLSDFSFIDIGCGNGWVVKKMGATKNCIKSVGIDGAEKMIQKAMAKDKNSKYFQFNIETMRYKEQFDIIFSMEVFYYFRNPMNVLNYIYKYILKPRGSMIIGIDHYLENPSSLSWSKDLNLDLQTYSINQWRSMFTRADFKNIKTYQFGARENWSGTLVIYCEK